MQPAWQRQEMNNDLTHRYAHAETFAKMILSFSTA
jgi:hypothetical protein